MAPAWPDRPPELRGCAARARGAACLLSERHRPVPEAGLPRRSKWTDVSSATVTVMAGSVAAAPLVTGVVLLGKSTRGLSS